MSDLTDDAEGEWAVHLAECDERLLARIGELQCLVEQLRAERDEARDAALAYVRELEARVRELEAAGEKLHLWAEPGDPPAEHELSQRDADLAAWRSLVPKPEQEGDPTAQAEGVGDWPIPVEATVKPRNESEGHEGPRCGDSV